MRPQIPILDPGSTQDSDSDLGPRLAPLQTQHRHTWARPHTRTAGPAPCKPQPLDLMPTLVSASAVARRTQLAALHCEPEAAWRRRAEASCFQS